MKIVLHLADCWITSEKMFRDVLSCQRESVPVSPLLHWWHYCSQVDQPLFSRSLHLVLGQVLTIVLTVRTLYQWPFHLVILLTSHGII